MLAIGGPGGQTATASVIENFPGFPDGITGAELIMRLSQQAQNFGVTVESAEVKSIVPEDSRWRLVCEDRDIIATAVILAVGASPRRLKIPGERDLFGRGVSYCATCDGAFFRGQDVAVIGNHDEAIEETLYLSRLANRVVVLSQTTELQASPEIVAQAEAAANVDVRLGHRVREVLGETEVEGLHVAPRSGEPYVLRVAAAFVYLQGNRPITDFLYGELPTTENGCLEVGEMMETAIPGVFAVGDVLCNHVKQVVIAAADGAKAAMGAERFLSGRERLRPDWS